MDAAKNTVYYLCITRGNRALYRYTAGDQEIDNLAVLCLEKIPLYHRWYFETFGRWKFGYFFEDSHVYFTITNKDLPSPAVLQLLQHVRDEYIKVIRRGSRGSFSGSGSLNFQEQLVPVLSHLITSLEQVSSNHDWSNDAAYSNKLSSLSPSVLNAASDLASSSKAPLLGKYDKSDKSNDHVIELEDRKSTERGMRSIDSVPLDSHNQTSTDSPSSMQKEFGLMRTRSNSQMLRRRWCLKVRIILAIDVAVCLILFGVWMWICHGLECIR